MPDPSIVCSGLSYVLPDGTVVLDGVSFTVGPGLTGLVAPNGAGKTTLLRLVEGSAAPTTGAVTVDGTVGLLPQELPFTDDLTVAEVLGVSDTRAALAAIEAGDTGEDHFATIGDDWDVEERSRAELDRVGLTDIGLDRTLDTLSGGQVVSLGLAALLLRRPDVLLLDEPTNNLDRAARERLFAVLDGRPGCVLVATHDRELLERADRIAELGRDGIRVFTGNLDAYTEAVRVEREAAERAVRSAEQDVKREKRAMQLARERADRRANTAARGVADAGLPKIVAGKLKRKAQESAARSDRTHGDRVDQARTRLDDAERALTDDAMLVLDLPDTTVPAGRTVVAAQGIRVRELFGAGVDLTIRGPERIALVGANGSGKSTLLRVLSEELVPDAGEVRGAGGRVARLSQRLDLLDPARTVLQNLEAVTDGMALSQRMTLLARFLFPGDEAHKPVGVLSGGERLRATLACVLLARPAPQLLLLDEPTNNLDMVSTARLAGALRAFRGALVVVSHDERFLADAGVGRRVALAAGALTDAAPAT
ncbi:ABC-F family ATP-binding cassette domain-containing protein [Pseudonocardia sp.]|uniref:ABC-F family ATP-binding cassette domain-containing protein n=1 Tax=Pseudonocardia sp. TaxID=60912 RepID=UPI003D0B5119